MEINYSHCRPNDPQGYSLTQAMLILGRLSFDDVSYRMTSCLYKLSQKFGDDDVTEFVKPFVTKHKEDAKANLKEYNRNYEHTHYFAKKENRVAYSDYQKSIINQEIPLKDVNGNEIRKILTIAYMTDDYDVIKKMQGFQSLIKERKMEKGSKRLYGQDKSKQLKEELKNQYHMLFSNPEISIFMRTPSWPHINRSLITNLYNKAIDSGLPQVYCDAVLTAAEILNVQVSSELDYTDVLIPVEDAYDVIAEKVYFPIL